MGAVLHQDGHEVHFLHVEGLISEWVPFEDEARARQLLAESPLISRDVLPLGDLFISPQRTLDPRDLELLLEYVGDLRPDAVGLSAWVSLEALCGQITGALRQRFPSLPIIWGGTIPTLDPEAALAQCEIICVGQGELALREWARSPGRRDIPGLWFREGEAIRRNGIAPAPDLDSLPFPLYRHNERTLGGGAFRYETMMDPAYVGRNVILSTTRHCRFDCAYCLSGRMRRACQPGTPQRLTVDRFLDEIEHLGRQCQLAEPLTIWDDDLTEDLAWVREFSVKYPQRIGKPFTFNAHPAHASREALALLCQAGAEGVALGLQSGSPRLLREVYQRSPEVDKLVDLAHYLRGLGIRHLQIDMITNAPYETDEDCRATFETLLRLPRPCDPHPAKLVIYPGSRLAAYHGPHGGLTDRDFDFWNMLYLLAGTGALSDREMRTLSHDAHLREHPWILRKLAHAVLDGQERDRCQQTIIARQEHELKVCGHLLQNSCHKSLGAIVRDKVRYRLARWRNGTSL